MCSHLLGVVLRGPMHVTMTGSRIPQLEFLISVRLVVNFAEQPFFGEYLDLTRSPVRCLCSTLVKSVSRSSVRTVSISGASPMAIWVQQSSRDPFAGMQLDAPTGGDRRSTSCKIEQILARELPNYPGEPRTA